MATSSAVQAHSMELLVESARRLEDCERQRTQRATEAAERRARAIERRAAHS